MTDVSDERGAAGTTVLPLVYMILHAYYHGDARVKREARTLAKRCRVHVLFLCGRDEPPGISRDGDIEIDAMQVASRNLPRNPAFWFLKYLEFIVRSAWRASRARPDVYHAHDLPMVIPALLARLLHRAPIIYDSHELFSEMTQHSPALARFWRAVDRFVVKRVDYVIAVNRSRADVMVEEYGAPEPTILPNLPVRRPPEDFPRPADSPLRRFVDEHVPGSPPIVLYQGMLGPGRSLDTVVRALARVESRCVLVIVGYRTPTVDDLLRVAREEGVADRVLYHDGVESDRLHTYTVGADVGVVIYAKKPRNNYLCAPNKLFDYCMAGVPVVGCDFPEVRRVLSEHPIGELFDVDDPDTLAAGLDALLQDPERMARARAATRQVAAQYHWETARAELDRLYDRVLGPRA